MSIVAFVQESNRIEGIDKTTDAHIDAHLIFLGAPVTVLSLVALVDVLQPDARLRNKSHVPGVRVGNHVAPPSGPSVVIDLERILTIGNPWHQHVEYVDMDVWLETAVDEREGRETLVQLHDRYDDIKAWLRDNSE